MFADFPASRRGAPVEIAVDRSAPLAREWAIVCDGPGFAACPAAWEVPESSPPPDARRRFETIWTTEPEAVRTATTIAWGLAHAALAELPEPAALRHAPADPAEAARRTADLANRMLAYVTA